MPKVEFKKDLFKVNLNARQIYRGFRSQRDSVKIFTNNTYEHELAKFRICFYLQKNKRTYMTEATFNDGGRADVVDLSSGVIYEVVNTEKEKSIEMKRNLYPFPIVKVIAKDINNTKIDELYKYLD